MNFTKEGTVMRPGEEPVLGPGVRGTAFDTPKGIYIPLISADREGSGNVSAFLDSLPADRRVVFPCVINSKLAGMLQRRGFSLSVEYDSMSGGFVEVYQRCPSATHQSGTGKEGR